MKEKATKAAGQPAARTEKSGDPGCPIVGIGASAGGLEPLERFLANTTENSGLAYVIIQHLDPTQKGMLPELLQRSSRMEVVQARHKMVVVPDRVYVIPPNKSMAVVNGVLQLSKPAETRGLRLPIDYFFISLAEDRKDLSIGVILSGMGSDGKAGLQAIKEMGGLALVQDPTTSKFDSMPLSAINAVKVDAIASPEELPSRILSLVKHLPVNIIEARQEQEQKSALERIIVQLRKSTGNDFSLYKRNTLYRRIERRMAIHKIDKIGSYVPFLEENPKEVDILFRELMIGVTNFFRDAPVWEYLREKALPDVLAKRQPGTTLRAWVAGCSTGEEAYTLAMVFKEVIESNYLHGSYSLQIFATDLDIQAIEKARKGLFPQGISADITPKRLADFFTKVDGGYRINTEIRDMIVFANHNIIMHPPFTKLDILSCRNLLIYLEARLQSKLLKLFQYSLKPDGILMLGTAETPGSQSPLFTAINPKLKLFKPFYAGLPVENVDFPSSFSNTNLNKLADKMAAKSTDNLQFQANQLLLEQFSPAAVFVNEEGDIIYISGHTGKYLEPAIGKANMNIFAMLREGISGEFLAAFLKVIQKKDPVVLRNIKIGSHGGKLAVDINIQWVSRLGALKGLILIIFNDLPDSASSKRASRKGGQVPETGRVAELELELQRTKDALQSAFEEMQTSQEELKSTNEELQSTNEELQSTNEELTTSKEEMQSMNEELQTLNAELMSKVESFSRVNNDMKNLLNSTDIATLFLDKGLNIRRFTDQATKLFKLIKSDIGRPITDQVSGLIYPELANDAKEVLKTLVYTQKQVCTRDGNWFSVRIMPYRSFDDRIDGLVITFINISELKVIEGKFAESERLARLLLNSSTETMVVLTKDWKIAEVSQAAEKYFVKKRKDLIAKDYFEVLVPPREKTKTKEELIKRLKNSVSDRCKLKLMGSKGNLPVSEWSVKTLGNDPSHPSELIVLTKYNQS